MWIEVSKKIFIMPFIFFALLLINFHFNVRTQKDDYISSFCEIITYLGNDEKIIGNGFYYQNKIVTSSLNLKKSNYNKLIYYNNLYIRDYKKRTTEAKIVFLDEKNGLACLKPANLINFKNLISNEESILNEEVFTLYSKKNDQRKVVKGNITSLKSRDNTFKNINLFESDFKSSDEICGAPVFNKKEELIGMLVVKDNLHDEASKTYIMPLKCINEILKGKYKNNISL